jgi:hypothetical protein
MMMIRYVYFQRYTVVADAHSTKSYITASYHEGLWNKFPQALCKIQFEIDLPHVRRWKPCKTRLLIHTVSPLQLCAFSLKIVSFNKLTFLWMTLRLLIQISWPLTITKPQSQTSHRKMKIICDADLHNKFRNNPHEKNASLFLWRETAVRQHSQFCSMKDVAEYSHNLFSVGDLLYHIRSM